MTANFNNHVNIVGERIVLPALIFAYGFSYRKRAIVRRFVGNAKVKFIRCSKLLKPNDVLLLWGSHEPPASVPINVQIIRLEDGFLRSVGLGADLIQPLSWVMDQRGIYYDARQPSDLEYLLQTTNFTDELLNRAANLRSRLVENGLTKYNVGSGHWDRPSNCSKVILVPGQVETDASIRFGAPGIATNMLLLQAVRQENKDAYVIYKPHPDVVAGLRAKGQREDDALLWCDEIVLDVGINEMLAVVDEVDVLTSLAGFEALLRGKQVVCYGQPFYSGWGLTKDILPIARRIRNLSLDELVAGTLILYPTYISRCASDKISTPEKAMDELLDWRRNNYQYTLPIWKKILRMALRFIGRFR